MDSRLQRVGGTRLTHIRYSDVPRVAQAIMDAMDGRARVLSGLSHDTPYIEFVRPKFYTVVVRGDDWRKIFPLLRYSASSYRPVIPPANQPPPVMSPQPNRTMQPPPVNPAGGLRSFLDGFSFAEYAKLQRVLTTMSLTNVDQPHPAWKPTTPYPDPTSLIPPERQLDSTSYHDTTVYNRLVEVLQQIFPTDYPTRF